VDDDHVAEELFKEQSTRATIVKTNIAAAAAPASTAKTNNNSKKDQER